MTQQDVQELQRRVRLTVVRIVMQECGIEHPNEVTNSTKLGERYQRILERVGIELGQIETLHSTFSPESTVADVVGAFT